jgi:oligosaccharide repeat unit polymerase
MVSESLVQALLYSGIINLGFWLIVCIWAYFFLRMPIYHPFSIYLIYHFLGYVVRPLSVWQSGWSFIWFRIGFQPSALQITDITILSNLSLAFCCLGFTYGHRAKVIQLLRPTRLIINRPFHFYSVAIILALLGLYSSYRGYSGGGLDSVNGFDAQVDAAGGQRLQDISGYTLALAESLPVLCIVLLLSNAKLAISGSAVGAFILLRLYIGAQRLSFIVVLAVAVFNNLIASGRRFPRLGLIVLVSTGAIAFDVIGNDRYALRRVAFGESTLQQVVDNYILDKTANKKESMDVVEYETASATMHIVDNLSGYSYGSQYLRAVIWPIPRQLWPEKPVFTSTVNLNAYGYNFWALTHTLYADLYMVFGYPWVAIGMFFWGWLMAIVYKRAFSTQSPMMYVFFWIFLVYMKTVLRDGEVTFVFFWGFSSLFAFVLIKAGRITIVRPFLKQRKLVTATPHARRLKSLHLKD